MKTKVIDSIKFLAELISPSGDKMSAGDVQWHVNTLREDNRQLQDLLHKAQQQRTEALEKLEDAGRRLRAYETTTEELRANLGVPAGTSLREYAKLIDAPRLNALEQKYKALVAEMASVRRLTNAADNVDTVDQVRAVMDREILAQAMERQLVTDKLELSKKLRAVKRANADLVDAALATTRRNNGLTEELATLSKYNATLVDDLQLEHGKTARAKEEAEEATGRAERWESKSKEWYDALEAERKTVTSLLEDRRLLHEANKKILALTGARSNETPVMAVERLAEAYRDNVGE